ncbi:MAG: hypothetical protein NT062_38075 [Proteobacteria bacterium]|nr:hypothetical protein [Pseudomonadota bacterium]
MTRPKLLASLHDVSPITLAASRAAVSLVVEAGVPIAALTVLVVPFHEESVALADHPAEVCFANAGIQPYGFVPPAWLLSREAAGVVAARGYAFVERVAGILVEDARHARRLIGWGSLTRIEALATSAFAWLQTRRRAADTRLAIHPQDLVRARSRRSLQRTLARLVTKLDPMSYRAFLELTTLTAPREPRSSSEERRDRGAADA